MSTTTTRRSTRTTLTCTAALLALGASFGAAAPAQAAQAPQVSAPSSAAAHPAAVAAAAKQVSRADVDGDGRRDTTTLTPARANGAAAVVVRTVTARGKSSSILVGTPWLFNNDAWFGAAGIDGAPGAELVLRTGYGAHTQFFRVLAWRGGKLVSQRDPSTGSTTWITDGALSVSMGYRASTIRGVRTLVATAYVRDGWGKNATMSGTISTSKWRGGAWRVVSTKKLKVKATSQSVGAAYGWHVAGLPVG